MLSALSPDRRRHLPQDSVQWIMVRHNLLTRGTFVYYSVRLQACFGWQCGHTSFRLTKPVTQQWYLPPVRAAGRWQRRKQLRWHTNVCASAASTGEKLQRLVLLAKKVSRCRPYARAAHRAPFAVLRRRPFQAWRGRQPKAGRKFPALRPGRREKVVGQIANTPNQQASIDFFLQTSWASRRADEKYSPYEKSICNGGIVKRV